MNIVASIDWTELSIQWMLTCGHFLWQGFLVAIVFISVERLAIALMNSLRAESDSNASLRYALACTALMSLPICIILTFASIHNTRGPFLEAVSKPLNSVTSRNNAPEGIVEMIEPVQPFVKPITEVPTPQPLPSSGKLTTELEARTREPAPNSTHTSWVAPMISLAYAIGVGILLLRLCVSILGSCRFRNAAQRVTDPQFLNIVKAQATRLKLKTVPLVASCARVSSPVVVGILRPMILMPPSLLCGLDPTQLAAILSHELAHIRRYDPLINLIQRIIESLLFFHPITWWISRRMSIERENCCDDIAALYIGRLTYAEALLQMASVCLTNHRGQSHALATLAADGSNATDFGYRIRRLIDAKEAPQVRFTKRSVAIGLIALSCLWASLISFAQSPKTENDKSSTSQLINVSESDGIQWSTWGADNGLLSGARLILPDGGVQPGQSVAVEYRLKNVSTETKSTTCYVRGNRTYLTLGKENRISDMGFDITDTPIQITLEPGEEYVDTSHRATIDTSGLSPGDYEVALGSAFFYPDESDVGAKHEIPHRGSIPFKIQGAPIASIAHQVDNSIVWGKPISGLRLGAKFRAPSNTFSIGDVVEADLWIGNATNQPIECSILLPHPMDGWLFNVQNDRGDTIMLERPLMVSVHSPQMFLEIKLAPGEIKAITGEHKAGQASISGRCAKFEIAINNEEKSWKDYTVQGRLVSHGGDYSAVFNVLLKRPEVPGMRIELETDHCPFTVGQPDPRVARVLDEATDSSILWGEPSGGLRLGIRQSNLARQRTTMRHGEHLDYEVWIKNETDREVRISRDPRDLQTPSVLNDKSINVIGGGTMMSFMIPPEALAKAELVLQPGQAARRFLSHSHSTSIRPPGSQRGLFGSDPLFLEPGIYKVFAQIGELKSGVEEIDVRPESRLQLRKASPVTDSIREYATKDPSNAILTWQSAKGEKHEAMINWDHGIFIDERDLASAEITPIVGESEQFTLSLKLLPESSKWLARRIRMYSLWDNPNLVALLLDGKPIGSVNIPSSITDDTLNIECDFSRQQAESIAKEIRSAIALHSAQIKPNERAATTPSKPKGITLTGQVEIPKDEWLFRRQLEQLPNLTPSERTRDFRGDTIDPEDRRLVHELTWKDVQAVYVTVKANDGRDFSKTIQTDSKGVFRFNDPLPPGSYQIDADAILTMDDQSQNLLGIPPEDLRSGTKLLRVEETDTGAKSFTFELYPVPFSNRLRHADPAKRSTIEGNVTENNQPVPNAKIILYGGLATRWKIAESTSDEHGHYRFENVIGDFIGVQVKHERLVPADGKNWRDINGPQIGTPQRLDMQMTAGGFIAGQLIDNNKQPRSNLPLRIMLTAPGVQKGSSNFVVYATTDANGAFTSEPLYPGTYVIEENMDSFTVLGEIHVTAGQTSKL